MFHLVVGDLDVQNIDLVPEAIHVECENDGNI